MTRTQPIAELLPKAVAGVRGLGLPLAEDSSGGRVAVSLPKGRAAVMSVRDCRWTVLDAVYRPSRRAQVIWKLIRLIPMHLLPVCSAIVEQDRQPQSASRAVGVLEGLGERCVVYVGGSQPRPSIVIAALGEDDTISGVTRVGYDAPSCAQVAREQQLLRALCEVQIPGVKWPVVVAFMQADAVCACTFTAPTGRPADLHTPSRERMVRANAAVVTHTAHERTLGDVLPDTIPHELANHILLDMPEGWEDVVIPCAMVHGDFAPWNARMVGEDVFLFDWTNGAVSGPAFYDRLYLSHQLERLISRGGPNQCAALLADVARAEYANVDADIVVRTYLLWRLADAVANESDADVAEVATIWNAFQGGVVRA